MSTGDVRSPLRLLVLAAGLGRRFGGGKQTAPVGPGGAWIMDYAVEDALGCGVRHVVVVVRPGIQDEVARHLESRIAGRAELTLVPQTPGAALPEGTAAEGRRTPWGTAHAVLVARGALPGRFVVVNADDLYGTASLRCLVRDWRTDPRGWRLVGYPLEETLSDHGPVNRGLCRVDSAGWLEAIEECEGIARTPEGGVVGAVGGRRRRLDPTGSVSMNLWGFDAAVFPILEAAFADFVADPDRPPGAELPLPDVVGDALAAGRARVRVLPCGDGWIGMTHPGDRGAVRAALRRLGPPGTGAPGSADGTEA